MVDVFDLNRAKKEGQEEFKRVSKKYKEERRPYKAPDKVDVTTLNEVANKYGKDSPEFKKVSKKYKEQTQPEQQQQQKVPQKTTPGILERVKDFVGGIRSGQKAAAKIDKNKEYQLEDGRVVSGEELREMIFRSGVKQAYDEYKDTDTGMSYIEYGGKEYQLRPETAELYNAASPERKRQILESLDQQKDEDFVGPVRGTQYHFSKAYEEMSEQEKAQYNIKYILPYVDKPEEIKYYPGGRQYLENLSEEEKQQLIDRYLEENPDLQQESEAVRQRDLTRTLFPRKTEDIPDGTQYTPVSERQKRDTAWDLISKTEQDLKEKYYGQLDPYAKGVLGYSRGVTETVATPITLPQAVIKYATGEQVGPDVSGALQRQPGAGIGPTGIQGAIASEAIGFVTGKGSQEFEKIAKDPLTAVGASFGEFVGDFTLGALVRPGVSKVSKEVVKPTIRKIPKRIKEIERFATYKPAEYLSPGNFLPSVRGTLDDFPKPKSQVLQGVYKSGKRSEDITSRISKKLGQTTVGKNVKKWARGYKPAKTYKLAKRKTGSRLGETGGVKYDFWAQKETYKPKAFGKEWISPDDVSKFKKGLGTQFDETQRVVPTSQKSRISLLKTAEYKKLGLRKYTVRQGSVEIRKEVVPEIVKKTELKPTTKGSLYNVGKTYPKPKKTSLPTDEVLSFKKVGKMDDWYKTKYPKIKTTVRRPFTEADSLPTKSVPRTSDEFLKFKSKKPTPKKTPPGKRMLQEGYSYKTYAGYMSDKRYGGSSGKVALPKSKEQFVKGFGKDTPLYQSGKFYGGYIKKPKPKRIREFIKNTEAQVSITKPEMKFKTGKIGIGETKIRKEVGGLTGVGKGKYKKMAAYNPKTDIYIPTQASGIGYLGGVGTTTSLGRRLARESDISSTQRFGYEYQEKPKIKQVPDTARDVTPIQYRAFYMDQDQDVSKVPILDTDTDTVRVPGQDTQQQLKMTSPYKPRPKIKKAAFIPPKRKKKRKRKPLMKSMYGSSKGYREREFNIKGVKGFFKPKKVKL